MSRGMGMTFRRITLLLTIVLPFLCACSGKSHPVVIEVRNDSGSELVEIVFYKQGTKMKYFTDSLAPGASKQWSFIEPDPDVGILTVRLKNGVELSAKEHSIANGKVVKFVVKPDGVQIAFVQEGVLNF